MAPRQPKWLHFNVSMLGRRRARGSQRVKNGNYIFRRVLLSEPKFSALKYTTTFEYVQKGNDHPKVSGKRAHSNGV